MRQKGFTLVELLVVVTLIAILAVAVLATINPIEQRRKAIDTSVKNAMAELLSAEERFYATYGCYTWEWDTLTNTCGLVLDPQGETDMGLAGPLLLQSLIDTGEVKGVLIDRIDQPAVAPWNTIALTEDLDVAQLGLLHVCFVPDSTAYTQLATCDAMASTDCDGTTITHICVPDSGV
jgi:prepilin-type N-terminal cleavage/methylation domain-containing protein